MVELKALESSARMLGQAFDSILRERHGEKIGFVVLVFKFGEDGGLAYLSNARREDGIKMLQEFIERAEGRD